LVLAQTLVVLAGCAAPPAEKAGASKPVGPYFYPVPPAAPRIQHLVTLSSRRDLQEERSAFAQFVAGKEKNTLALVQPYGAALYEGKLLVADTGAPGLAIFDLEKRRMALQPGAGTGRMKRPVNITVDKDGMRYVTDTGNDQVMVYDRDDRFVRAFGDGKAFRPVDVAIAGDRLYVVDILHHRLLILDKRAGTVLQSIGKAGSGKGELFQPTNIAIGPDGDLFVAETGNFRVQRFKPDGTHVRFYGEPGDTPGTFARPKGIAVDRAGRLYVGDSAFQNVQIFDDSGKLLMEFGRMLEGLDGLNLPAAVRLDYDHVPLFARYADPRFSIEHLVLVVSQFGPNKVDVYGYGRMAGVDYDSPAAAGKR
jgi:sugar lactone lactonase YvrE